MNKRHSRVFNWFSVDFNIVIRILVVHHICRKINIRAPTKECWEVYFKKFVLRIQFYISMQQFCLWSFVRLTLDLRKNIAWLQNQVPLCASGCGDSYWHIRHYAQARGMEAKLKHTAITFSFDSFKVSMNCTIDR